MIIFTSVLVLGKRWADEMDHKEEMNWWMKATQSPSDCCALSASSSYVLFPYGIKKMYCGGHKFTFFLVLFTCCCGCLTQSLTTEIKLMNKFLFFMDVYIDKKNRHIGHLC